MKRESAAARTNFRSSGILGKIYIMEIHCQGSQPVTVGSEIGKLPSFAVCSLTFQVFIPTSTKTLHLYEARYLALLDDVSRCCCRGHWALPLTTSFFQSSITIFLILELLLPAPSLGHLLSLCFMWPISSSPLNVLFGCMFRVCP